MSEPPANKMPTPDPRTPSHGDRAKRIEALRALTEVSKAPSPAAPEMVSTLTPPRRPRWRALWLGGAIPLAVLVAIVATLVAHQTTSRAKTGAPPALLTLQFPVGPIGCPQQVAWSPNGARLAVLGYQMCPDPSSDQTGLHPTLALYEAVTGHVLTAVSLEPALIRSVTHGAALDSYEINFHAPSWSPDGDRIAVFFAAFTQNGAGAMTAGALLYTVASGVLAAIVVPPTAAHVEETPDEYTVSSAALTRPAGVRFDVLSDRATVFGPGPSLLYTWGDNGELTPLIGERAHGGAWPQGYTGTLEYLCPPKAASYFWISAGGAAWSPDGRYFVNSLGGFGALPDTVPSHDIPASGVACPWKLPKNSWQVITPPLAGLRGVESAMVSQKISELTFTTSSNGARIITLDNGSDGSGGPESVSVYNGLSGAQVDRFTPDQIRKAARLPDTSTSPYISVAAPAPDGKALALLDSGNRRIIIVRTPYLQ